VCKLSVLTDCDINNPWSTGDAEFAVRLFGNGLFYGLHHGRYFHYQF